MNDKQCVRFRKISWVKPVAIMKRHNLAITAIGCLIFTPFLSLGQVLVNDNFDGYSDQAAFLAAWPQVGATVSGTLTSLQSDSAPNSINYATTAQRNERSFAETGVATALNTITFSFDFYDANSAASPYRQYANLQDGASPSSGGQLISMGLNNNLTSPADGGNFFMARILGYNANAYFKLNTDPLLLRTTGWHNLAVTISDQDFKFYVDGSLAETVPQTGLTLRSYDVVRLGSGLSSTTEAYFDNVLVQVNPVPEPTVAALAGIGICALIGLRRSRN